MNKSAVPMPNVLLCPDRPLDAGQTGRRLELGGRDVPINPVRRGYSGLQQAIGIVIELCAALAWNG
jgi:hypothetical protein